MPELIVDGGVISEKAASLGELFLKEYRHDPLLIDGRKACGPYDYSRADQPKYNNGILVLAVSGLLTESARFWGTTYSEIRAQVKAAVEDDACKGILLQINSPGGSTDKAFETAAYLAKAAKKKPIWAVANSGCYSAAYLLASQTGRICVLPMAGGVGSIGVYTLHVEYSGMLEQGGVNVTLISAGEGKTDGNPYEPLSKSAEATLRADVDRLYKAFVEAVARGRAMNEESINSLGAALYAGQDAISARLADAIVDEPDEALEAFAARLNLKTTISAAASAGANSTQGVNMSEEKKAGAVAAAEDEEKKKQESAKAKKTANDTEDDDEEDEDEEEMKKDKKASAAFTLSAKVLKLCATAGISTADAAEFVAMLGKGKSYADVCEAIINRRAESAGEEISTAQPAVEKTAAAKTGAGSPLVKAMEARAGQKGAK